MKRIAIILSAALFLFACDKKKEDLKEPELIFNFKFDPTQQRLDNFGQPGAMPAGNSGQSPEFNLISAHYIELTPSMFTQVGNGEVLYKHEETTAGGGLAIDFSKSIKVGEGETFLSLPIKDIEPGTYEYLRVSLSYQNYDINLRANGMDLTGTLASFIGYNTYISSFNVQDKSVSVNANKKQGYWAFETDYSLTEGQAPGTTVPNPIAATSPIPAGSCLVTGKFNQPFTITGNEEENMVITISLSTNNSFEWKDANGDGKFEPLAGDTVVDMGIRGLIPLVN